MPPSQFMRQAVETVVILALMGVTMAQITVAFALAFFLLEAAKRAPRPRDW